MSKDNNKSTGVGIGFTGLLAILFIALKLIGIISWSWVWVLSPLWVPLVLTIVILVIVMIIYIIKDCKKKKRKK